MGGRRGERKTGPLGAPGEGAGQLVGAFTRPGSKVTLPLTHSHSCREQ